MAKLIRKYTADHADHTKVAFIYQCSDDEGFTFFEAVGRCEGVDPPPHGNWQNDDLEELCKDVKNWL
jgi:hypothetical protein